MEGASPAGTATIRFLSYAGNFEPAQFVLTTTVQQLKEYALAKFPPCQPGEAPASVADIRLFHAGKMLDNESTLIDMKVPASPDAVTAVHLNVKPSIAPKTAAANAALDEKKQAPCGCAIA